MGLAIWLVLILALIVPKANHDIRVLLILLPLVIVNLLWWLFMKFTGMNSTDAQEFSLIFQSMAVGMTVLWLITNYFVRFGGAIRFLLSFVTVVIVAGLGTLSYSTEFSNETAMFIVLFILMVLTMLTAITLSRRLCGGKYRPVCFMLWLVLWMLLVSLIATLGFLIVALMVTSSGPSLSEMILMFALAGLIFGLCLYVLNLPFMILGFAHPFFRKRFLACLRLKPMPVAQKQVDYGTEIPEKGDST